MSILLFLLQPSLFLSVAFLVPIAQPKLSDVRLHRYHNVKSHHWIGATPTTILLPPAGSNSTVLGIFERRYIVGGGIYHWRAVLKKSEHKKTRIWCAVLFSVMLAKCSVYTVGSVHTRSSTGQSHYGVRPEKPLKIISRGRRLCLINVGVNMEARLRLAVYSTRSVVH